MPTNTKKMQVKENHASFVVFYTGIHASNFFKRIVQFVNL